MADIQTVTTAGATLIVFGSKAKADINPDTDTGKAFWEDNPGAIVFPTDENKVYFGGAAYDGMNFDQLKTLLSENYGLQLAIDNTINTGKERGYYTATEIQVLLRGLQNVLTAGTGITITETKDEDGNITATTISAKPDEIVTADVVNPIIEANETVTSIKETADSASVKATTNATNIATLQTGKQDKLTAGDGISISADNVISSTLDLTLYKIVTALPSSNPDPTKIYLVKSAESTTNDIYEEYIWTGTAFEKLGEYKAEVDLTPYLTSATAENLYLKKALLKGKTVNGTEVAVTPTTETGSDGKPVTYHYISAALIIQ